MQTLACRVLLGCWVRNERATQGSWGEGEITQKVSGGLLWSHSDLSWPQLMAVTRMQLPAHLCFFTAEPRREGNKWDFEPFSSSVPIPRVTSHQMALLLKVLAGPFGMWPPIQPKLYSVTVEVTLDLEVIQIILQRMGFQENHSTGFLQMDLRSDSQNKSAQNHVTLNEPGQEGDTNSLADIPALMEAYPIPKSKDVDHPLPYVCTISAIMHLQNKGSLGCSSRSNATGQSCSWHKLGELQQSKQSCVDWHQLGKLACHLQPATEIKFRP